MADNVTQTGSSTIATDDIGGVHYQRMKNCYGADGTATDISASTPMPVFELHTGRTFMHLWASGAAAGATTVETAITLTRSPAPGSATTTGTSWTPTSGKRFRITSLSLASRGHATATAQVTTFSLRVNTAGATATTSAIVIQARVATPATALAWDRWQFAVNDDGLELAGDGTLTFGITANAVFTTNAPTWDVVITGYEYTP